MLTRKQFLCGAAATGIGGPLLAQLLTARADAGTNGVVVLVDLGGGNDGFNTVFPITSAEYGAYVDQRPTIRIPTSQVQTYNTAFNTNVTTPSSTATQYAFHPALGSLNASATNNMRSLYGRGKLAVIAGVGLPASSHERENHAGATYNWAVGNPDGISVSGTGWAGNAVDNLHLSNISQLTFVNAAYYPYQGLVAASADQIIIPSDLNDFRIPYGPLGDRTDQADSALAATSTYALPHDAGEIARNTDIATIGLTRTIGTFAASTPLADYVTTYTPLGGTSTNSDVKQQFKQVARLLIAGSPTRVYYTGFGGVFDTHSAQNGGNYHHNLLLQFSEAVTEFLDYLRAHNASSNVIVMSISDFGRRPYENGSGGTDHGTASVSFIAGDPIKGGLYGQYPGLATSKLDSDGNALVPVDFRTHLAVGVQWLGSDPNDALARGFPSIASTLPGIYR